MMYLICYVLLIALANIFIHSFGAYLPPMLMVFLTTTFAILFFHLLAYRTIVSAYKKFWSVKKQYAGILLSITVVWIGTFLIPIYYSPAIQVFTFVGFTGLYGSLSAYRKNKKNLYLLKAGLIAIALIVFYAVCYQDYSLNLFVYLLAGSFVTGTAGFVYLLSSAKLNQAQFKSTEILAVRFWLLWIIPLWFVVSEHQYVIVDLKVLSETFLLSCLALIMPVFCLQKAIEKLGPDTTGILIGFIPFVTFILERTILNTEINWIGCLSIFLAFAISLEAVQRCVGRLALQ